MQVTAALQKSTLAAALALATLSTSVSANQIEDKPSAAAIVADAAIARPAYIILSQAGALIYGATLPLTLLTGSADAVAETLVVTPLQQGFLRCLGCRKINTEVSRMEEGDGKTIQHFVQLNAGYNMFKDKSLDEDANSAGGGFAVGTHFRLSDTSRFDVMLGARYLGKPDYDDAGFEDQVLSYQITSRFGRAIGDGVDIMGKLGVHRWQADWDVESPEEGESDSGSASGNGFLYGLGLDFRLSDSMRAGIEYTRYNLDDGKYEVELDTIDLTAAIMF
ncbi:outer membrane beta-barrel protein [Bacterioplanes sanyensis]|nr:outer membrane beta-barrel protein [Bacterioplanes sanyensis]